MAQNNNTSITIGFAISALLAVTFIVFWYMSFSDVKKLEAQLQAAQNAEQEGQRKVSGVTDQNRALRDLIAPGARTPVSADDDPAADPVVQEANKLIAEISGDSATGTGNLLNVARSSQNESDQNQMAAVERKQQLDAAAANLRSTIAKKDEQIEDHRQARDKAEQELAKKEATHAEQMKGLEDQIRTLRDERNDYQSQLATAKNELRIARQDWLAKEERMELGLVALRSRIRQAEDPTFSKPDGEITSVDHNVKLVFIDLGTADGLQKGATFSVYQQNHSGVGRSNTSDIKGKLEVTELLGRHRAKARIIDEDTADPIAPNDPIFSPIFQAGQTMEIALAGQINVDGLKREEFRRLVRAAGSKISVEVGPTGQFIDPSGAQLSEEEALSRITPRTRYLVIGDIGEEDGDVLDPTQRTQFRDMRINKEALEKECNILGIYPIGLTAFLEHIGFTPKQKAWRTTDSKPFPGKLANGARSSAINTRFGNRESSAAISGLFSDRRKASTQSNGNVSEKYQGK